MLQPGDIKGAIALELDAESVTAGDFLSCAEAFVSLLREVTESINKATPPDAWCISVQEGSQVVNVVPNLGRLPRPIADQIITTTVDGVHALEKEARYPRGFSEKAVENVRKLGRISTRTDTKRFPVRIIDKRRVTSVGRDVFSNSSALLDWKYEDLGTVEGALEALSVHGHYELRVWEPIRSRPINCLINDQLLETALSLFRRRVEVKGLIRYTQDGLPTSVKVEEITALPNPSELPSYRQMKGILGAQYDGAG